MIDTAVFKRSLGSLLAEAFGVSPAAHGFFLDSGSAGLLGTIAGLSAETASATLSAGEETIAAHCGHLLYVLELFDGYERGEQPAPDWEGSWSTSKVDEAAWESLRTELRAGYERAAAQLAARDAWPEPAVGAWMMLLGHVSYHVGVIHKLRSALRG
jgi:hypothetical protein